jgi:hypothetical protein
LRVLLIVAVEKPEQRNQEQTAAQTEEAAEKTYRDPKGEIDEKGF